MARKLAILPPSPERALLMAKVKQKDTRPELVVRKALYSLGYRYRLHDNKLPGTPDLVLKKHRLTVFVHGCFWHGHDCAHGSRVPIHNRDYWVEKIKGNRERDARKRELLEKLGWRVMVIWECDTKSPGFAERLAALMNSVLT